MTLDEFLRTFDGLIDAQVQDDDPGEGNFGCQGCRACYSCRFCVGCDSCEDCTYCEESVDCTSCTQSKRCVTCEKVSYCEDCRDCKGSRYLTLCVDCKECTHCLACVGLEGGEFYVLNQKRSRKEYFALLRQVQELMRVRVDVGWRPPTIGLAADVRDPVQAGRDVELTTAPWLDELFGEAARVREEDERPPSEWDEPRPRERDLDAFAAELEVDDELTMPPRPRVREDAAVREPVAVREPAPSQAPTRARERVPAQHDEPAPRSRYDEAPRMREPAPTYDESPTRPRERVPIGYDDPARGREGVRPREPERWSSRDVYDEDPVEPHAWEDSREATVARPRPTGPSPRPGDLRPSSAVPRASESSSSGRIPRDPTPSAGLRLPRDSSSGRYPGPSAASPDPRRPRSPEPPREQPAPRRDAHWDDDELVDDSQLDERDYDARDGVPEPVAREREPSSPWLDNDAPAAPAKRSSLRRAGRPERRPDAGIESGTGTYRSGKKPSESLRGEPRDEGTRTGLRTGRRPKPK